MKSKQITSVGLVGVGLLGTAIGTRLIQSGFRVTGFDVDAARMAAWAQCGGETATHAAEVLAGNQVVVLSLPTSDHVAEVMGDSGTSATTGSIVIDTTTGDPDHMTAIADTLRGRGTEYLEGNVAGSSLDVARGKATLFIGGDERAVQRATPVLAAISEHRFTLGPVGSASRFKLVHNLILGLHRAVLAEGLTFAESLGFDAAKTLQVLQQTPASSAVMHTKGPMMVEREYAAQARLAQHHKDVQLILQLARRHGAATPLSEAHDRLLAIAETQGLGDLDNSAVIESYRSAMQSVGNS